MYIQSGEWVTILGDKVIKFKLKKTFLKSMRFRVMAGLIVIGMLPGFAMKALLLNGYEKKAVSLRTAEIQNQCTILANQISSSTYLTDSKSEVIDAELSQISNIYNGRALVIDGQFRIIKDTYSLEEGKVVVAENVVRCFEGHSQSVYDKKNHYIEVEVPIMVEDNVYGVVMVGASTDNIVECLEELRVKSNVVIAIWLIGLVVIALVFSDMLVRPFNRITNAISAVTEGYDTEYLHEDSCTETLQMSEAFNKMLGRLRVIDDSRQEFVSNVSHELKTPLTSMKVLADSLLSQENVPAELYAEFMGDIAEEIERENQIINDLLSLVKMDKTSGGLNIRSENINDLVERILKRLRPIAEKKNVEVVFESFRPVLAEVDEVKLSLAISNLVENAIKYNREGGYVHVSLNADHKFFYVKVEDSGIGIPEESIPHIFERFYRVDKSRSREIGGTGLGLSIARNAIIMHRGSVKVYSKEGEGTTFTVRVPLTHVS